MATLCTLCPCSHLSSHALISACQDVFTVSVGNLPPNTPVIIKIVYVCELDVVDEQLVFHLPTNLAPWDAYRSLSASNQVFLCLPVCPFASLERCVNAPTLLFR